MNETGVTITFLTKYGQFISTGMSTMKWNLEQREKNEAGVDLSCLLRKRRNV